MNKELTLFPSLNGIKLRLGKRLERAKIYLFNGPQLKFNSCKLNKDFSKHKTLLSHPFLNNSSNRSSESIETWWKQCLIFKFKKKLKNNTYQEYPDIVKI